MANSIQQVEMCEAFKKAGRHVHLVHPSYRSIYSPTKWKDVEQYYAVEEEFQITTVPSLNGTSVDAPRLRLLSMVGSMASWLIYHTVNGDIGGDDIVYGRSYYPMFVYNEFRQQLPEGQRPTLVFEVHNSISAHLKQRFYSSVDHIISITEKLKKRLVGAFGLPQNKISVEPDGVNYEYYQDISKEKAREAVGIHADDSVVMYTGHLYPGKGVETLVKAAKQLDTSVYIVGGYQSDVERIKEEVGNPRNVTYTGFVNPTEVPTYQKAADILVAPYTEQSREWVSPLKLFEYMAAGRPIVASDRQVLAEVLTHRKNALVFEKGNANALRQTVTELLDNKELYNEISHQVQQDVQRYRWEERARRIIETINAL